MTKWLKRSLIALALLIVVALVAPLLINVNDYIPRIEQEISARIHEPVTIQSINLSALPAVHITVDGITIGKDEDIKVGKVILAPDMFSFFSATKIVKSVSVEGLVLTRKALDKIPTWTRQDSSKPAVARIEDIVLSGAILKLDKAALGPFDARLQLNADGEPVDASFSTQDGKLKATVKPKGPNYVIDASAKSWQLAADPAVFFDELNVKGVATSHGADFSDINAKLYDGRLTGGATLIWDKGLRVKGHFDVERVELKSLAALLSPTTRITGKLNAKPVISSSAADASQIFGALRLETPFYVQNGVLHGVDIQKAATNLITKGGSGGETRFDQLSGHLVVQHGAYQFTQLKISSGALAADGNVHISARHELSGRVSAQVSAVGTSASVPLNVAGTVQTPLLYPTGATVAGAAVGTAILGPVLGTSVGAEIGGLTENLFGKTPDKKAKK